ncbi:Uncharacterised protein [Clostridioides difficile]|nr:Uncharacterised protein [Clostridioides difficile]
MRSQNATDDFEWFPTATSVRRRRVAVHMGSLTVSWLLWNVLVARWFRLGASLRSVPAQPAEGGTWSTSGRGHLVNQREGAPGQPAGGGTWSTAGRGCRLNQRAGAPGQPAGGGAGSGRQVVSTRRLASLGAGSTSGRVCRLDQRGMGGFDELNQRGWVVSTSSTSDDGQPAILVQ